MERTQLIKAMIGRPYDERGFNCWHLVSIVQASLFGRMLPYVDPDLVRNMRKRAREVASHPARLDWQEVPNPIDGAIVLMGGLRENIHCGTYLDPALGMGAVLHMDPYQGGALDSIVELERVKAWKLTYLVPR